MQHGMAVGLHKALNRQLCVHAHLLIEQRSLVGAETYGIRGKCHWRYAVHIEIPMTEIFLIIEALGCYSFEFRGRFAVDRSSGHGRRLYNVE